MSTRRGAVTAVTFFIFLAFFAPPAEAAKAPNLVQRRWQDVLCRLGIAKGSTGNGSAAAAVAAPSEDGVPELIEAFRRFQEASRSPSVGDFETFARKFLSRSDVSYFAVTEAEFDLINAILSVDDTETSIDVRLRDKFMSKEVARYLEIYNLVRQSPMRWNSFNAAGVVQVGGLYVHMHGEVAGFDPSRHAPERAATALDGEFDGVWAALAPEFVGSEIRVPLSHESSRYVSGTLVSIVHSTMANNVTHLVVQEEATRELIVVPVVHSDRAQRHRYFQVRRPESASMESFLAQPDAQRRSDSPSEFNKLVTGESQLFLVKFGRFLKVIEGTGKLGKDPLIGGFLQEDPNSRWKRDAGLAHGFPARLHTVEITTADGETYRIPRVNILAHTGKRP